MTADLLQFLPLALSFIITAVCGTVWGIPGLLGSTAGNIVFYFLLFTR